MSIIAKLYIRLTDQFLQLAAPANASGASYDTDDISPLCSNASAVRQPSATPSTGQNGQVKKPVSRGDSKPYQRKKPAQQASTTETESSTDAGRNAIMPKGGTRGSSLGRLPTILLTLRLHYFATLLNALCASERPFDDFQKLSPKFLSNSRTAFESVWPHLKIKVEMDDLLFNIVSLLIAIVNEIMA